HRALHHLDGPGDLHPGAAVLGLEKEAGPALEVAVHDSLDASRPLALLEVDPQAHAVREWWSDDAVEHGPGMEAAALEAEVRQPAPPGFEAVDALDGVPKLLGRDRAAEGLLVGDHARRVGHSM